MNRDAKVQSFTQKCIKASLFGLGIGVVILLVLLTAFSFLMSRQDVPKSAIGPVVIGVLMVAAFTSAFVTARLARNRGLLLGLLSGFLLYLVILFVSVVLFRTGFTFASVFKLVILMLSGAIGGICGVNGKKR